MHPHDRLKREILGERAVRDRSVVVALAKRDKPLANTRSVPGESMKLRTCEITYRRVWLEPGPNAPLLKRIVKYPYALEEVGRSIRVAVPKGLSAREKRESLPKPMQMAAAFRGVRRTGGPLKGNSLRPKPLPKVPSIEAWLTEKGDA